MVRQRLRLSSLLLTAVAALWAVAASRSLAAQTGENYYYFGNRQKRQKILLSTSSKYKAVWLTKEEVAGFASGRLMTQFDRRTSTLLLGNVLLVKSESPGFTFFAPSEIKERLVPVFAYQQVLLIPTDEVILRVMPRLPEESVRKLLAPYRNEALSTELSCCTLLRREL
jgi:hypothetical protein